MKSIRQSFPDLGLTWEGLQSLRTVLGIGWKGWDMSWPQWRKGFMLMATNDLMLWTIAQSFWAPSHRTNICKSSTMIGISIQFSQLSILATRNTYPSTMTRASFDQMSFNRRFGWRMGKCHWERRGMGRQSMCRISLLKRQAVWALQRSRSAGFSSHVRNLFTQYC